MVYVDTYDKAESSRETPLYIMEMKEKYEGRFFRLQDALHIHKDITVPEGNHIRISEIRPLNDDEFGIKIDVLDDIWEPATSKEKQVRFRTSAYYFGEGLSAIVLGETEATKAADEHFRANQKETLENLRKRDKKVLWIGIPLIILAGILFSLVTGSVYDGAMVALILPSLLAGLLYDEHRSEASGLSFNKKVAKVLYKLDKGEVP